MARKLVQFTSSVSSQQLPPELKQCVSSLCVKLIYTIIILQHVRFICANK